MVGLACGSKDLQEGAESPITGGGSQDSGHEGATDSGGYSSPPRDTAGDSSQDNDTGLLTVDDSLPYDQACFRASHNSYEGEARGTIVAQLQAGVRQIELDFHDNDYEVEGFRVGHTGPGQGVYHEGDNPDSNRLEDWLSVISGWSLANRDHAPINLLLNIKDDLTDNRSTSQGSLAALNSMVVSQFGERLFWARDHEGVWPTVNALRGKVIVGLTGRETTSSRVAYLRDKGVNPAVAINDYGQIIEVHKSESQDMLWFWTGQLQADGSVIWWHHGRYDSGRDPAVALNNHGVFVEVHRSHADNDLWSWTGRITSEGDLEFLENTEFSNGLEPTVAFDDLDGHTVRTIYQSPASEGLRSTSVGTVGGTGSLEWSDSLETTEALFSKASSTSEAGEVSVASSSLGASGPDTLVYETPGNGPRHIRYAQVAFIDSNDGDPGVVSEWTSFRSFRTGDHRQALDWRLAGGISRVWRFSSSDADALAVAPPQFGATDEPLSTWYQVWSEENGCED